jgi:hypothetical protein
VCGEVSAGNWGIACLIEERHWSESEEVEWYATAAK